MIIKFIIFNNYNHIGIRLMIIIKIIFNNFHIPMRLLVRIWVS